MSVVAIPSTQAFTSSVTSAFYKIRIICHSASPPLKKSRINPALCSNIFFLPLFELLSPLLSLRSYQDFLLFRQQLSLLSIYYYLFYTQRLYNRMYLFFLVSCLYSNNFADALSICNSLVSILWQRLFYQESSSHHIRFVKPTL